jgi:DNA (cytosine-5)-methyltransferase 1
LARLGLGPGWTCSFANDIDPAKGRAYVANFGREHLRVCDVASLTTRDLPGRADCAWMSPLCQDVSEAGSRVGLDGERSGAFWPAWRLIQGLNAEGRAPQTIVLENVTGLLTKHKGDKEAPVEAIRRAFEREGYGCAVITIDARCFVPQSRPRVFVIGAYGVASADVQALVDRAIEALPKSARSTLSTFSILIPVSGSIRPPRSSGTWR